jgi:hypothetical protein
MVQCSMGNARAWRPMCGNDLHAAATRNIPQAMPMVAARLHCLVVWKSFEWFLAVLMRVTGLRLNEYAFTSGWTVLIRRSKV